ncbi:MAG: IS481 family transposase [Gammaproteobacteria bacterium]|nr:IS481 family transposase [Gammaproteobacteria bacterium]MBQ74717.1 IS481 family transposase [Gammaproteobacteria bacterium]
MRRRLRVLKHAENSGSIARTCRYFGLPRSTFYRWKNRYKQEGEAGLVNKSTASKHQPNQTPPEIVEKVLYLRRKYHLGPIRIVWYLQRYHQIKISDAGVYRILRRHGVSRLPGRVGRRKVHTKRYEKRVPGHHIQIDVKFLRFVDTSGRSVRRFQYTAIDDATRIRALKIYERHTQKNAIDFVDHVIGKFPFRLHTIQTDRGHEFQAKFHWHVEDKGIRHRYIKPRTPQLNGKVERSHRTDQDEFYQLLSYVDDVDLNKKLVEWENFYNFYRPHGAFNGNTPYEALRVKLQ